MKSTLKNSAFTLIELLVVIAIIGLLMAVIMPALNLVKKQASASVCLSNVRQLVIPWRMYADDNDSRLCGPNTTNTGRAAGDNPSYDWVGPPIDRETGSQIGGGDMEGCTKEEEIAGIENGTLYPYYEDHSVTHCPADKRSNKAPTYGITGTRLAGDGGYRTYSIPIHLGSTFGVPDNELYVRLSDISTPGSRFCFLEENDSRNYNWNSWEMDENRTNPGFVDPFGIFHGDKGIMGFVDGHADKVVWRDDDTKQYSQDIFDGTRTGFSLYDPGNVDLQWLAMHYPIK